MRPALRQRGQLLVAGVVLIVVVALMVVALGFLYVSSERSSTLHNQSDAAYFAARSRLEYVRRLYLTGTVCGAGLNTTQPVGNNSFTTSGATLYNVSSAGVGLGGVTAAVTTIPVDSTAGYAPLFGRVVIDREEMYYGAISGNNFVNVKRGTSNTVAAAHAAGAVVVQGLCNITSIGTAGSANRTLKLNMARQNYQQGVLTKRNGAAGTGTQSVTGVGFRPNAVIFFWTRLTTNGTITAQANSGVGFATSPADQYAVVVGMVDGQGTMRNGRRASAGNAIIFLDNNTANPNRFPQLLAQANLQSMDTDGFTLNWTTNGDANAYRIYYIAIGGDTDAFVGNFDMNNATGNQPVTGTGFQPDLVMFIHAADGAIDAVNAGDAEFGIGFAQSSTAGGAMVYSSQTGVANATPGWQQITNKPILFLNHAPGNNNPPTQAGQADFVSMDTNGFTIKVTTPSGGANWNVGYLALRGARVASGAFNQRTSVGTQSPVTVAFYPQGIMLAGRDLATAATVAAGRTSVGAAGGNPIVSGNVWFEDQSGVGNSNTNIYNDATNIISMGTNVNPPTNLAQATLQSLSLGGFTLNWTAADAVAREIMYWAIGPRDYADVEEIF